MISGGGRVIFKNDPSQLVVIVEGEVECARYINYSRMFGKKDQGGLSMAYAQIDPGASLKS